MIPDPMIVSNFQGCFLLLVDTFNNGEFYGFRTWIISCAVLYLISDFTARLQAMLRFFFCADTVFGSNFQGCLVLPVDTCSGEMHGF